MPLFISAAQCGSLTQPFSLEKNINQKERKIAFNQRSIKLDIEQKSGGIPF